MPTREEALFAAALERSPSGRAIFVAGDCRGNQIGVKAGSALLDCPLIP